VNVASGTLPRGAPGEINRGGGKLSGQGPFLLRKKPPSPREPCRPRFRLRRLPPPHRPAPVEAPRSLCYFADRPRIQSHLAWKRLDSPSQLQGAIPCPATDFLKASSSPGRVPPCPMRSAPSP